MDSDKPVGLPRRVTTDLHRTRQRLREGGAATHEPIAVVPTSRRFPGVRSSPEDPYEPVGAVLSAVSPCEAATGPRRTGEPRGRAGRRRRGVPPRPGRTGARMIDPGRGFDELGLGAGTGRRLPGALVPDRPSVTATADHPPEQPVTEAPDDGGPPAGPDRIAGAPADGTDDESRRRVAARPAALGAAHGTGPTDGLRSVADAIEAATGDDIPDFIDNELGAA